MITKKVRSFYFSPSGRVGQGAYIKYMLLPLFFILCFLYALDVIIQVNYNFLMQVVISMICLMTILSFFIVSIKRCHDRSKSGQFLWILIIPLVGWIWVMLELVIGRSRTGPNLYGNSPSWR